MTKQRCSSIPPPTRGLSTTTSTPASLRTSAGPIPESWSSRGLLTLPNERITSRRAWWSTSVDPRRTRTPVMRSPSRNSFTATEPVSTVRLARSVIGWMNARAELHRSPLRIVVIE